jgi:hypothetical protein
MLHQWLSNAVIAILMMGTESTRNMYSDVAVKLRYWCYILLDILCVYL